MSISNKCRNQIKLYLRYVDDTFLLFNGTCRKLGNVQDYINNINNNIRFKLKLDDNYSVHLLDFTIRKNNNQIEYNIYRKPTTIDITIHAHSHHPYSQKIAAFNAFEYRMLAILLGEENRMEEMNIIKSMDITENSDRLIRTHTRKIDSK